MALSENFWLKALVGKSDNPAVGSETTVRAGRSNEMMTAEIRGRWSELTQLGKVFHAVVSGVTIPVVASNLVSVFGIYNPPGSGIDVELIDVDISQVLATTVVDAFGLYADTTAALAAAATFTTQLTTVTNRRLMDPNANKARVYSAVTHSGTPRKVANIGQDGAVTNAGSAARRLTANGQLILPPGILMSVAASTAAGTASGMAIDFCWAEIPLQS